MSYNPKPYEGDITLQELEKTCETEQIAGLQLTDIRYGTKTHDGKVFPVNKAAYEEKTIGRLRNLSFNEVSGNDDAVKIKEKIKNEGWTFICDTQVYAKKEGQTRLVRVIVAGKKAL